MMGNRDLTDDDVADAVLFLSSRLSDLVQGETLTVDGGSAAKLVSKSPDFSGDQIAA